MDLATTLIKLKQIGLRGQAQGTGDADYVRVFVLDAAGVTLGRITIFKGQYDHIKWYSGIIKAYNIDQRRPTLAWDMLLQSGQVLTDEMWSSIKVQAQEMQLDATRQLQQWRRDNPPKLDHNGNPKRRRSIKGPSIMKCIRLIMNLSGAY